jgi:catechol 2,3-dioxygenase-like lactoylglutathione lyase family enzyme
MKLELVPIPVTDVDRAKSFYVDKVGFNADHDHIVGPELRFVQLTPPGSACSVVLGLGITDMPPGSQRGVQMVVADAAAARAELAGRGVEIGEVQVYDRDGSRRPARDDDALNNVGFAFFADPDGNTWSLQQIDART